jgi:hypothetical protein
MNFDTSTKRITVRRTPSAVATPLKWASAFMLLSAVGCVTAQTDLQQRAISFAGFRLWGHTLDFIQRELGPAPVFKAGDASDSVTSICYRLRGAFISFYSGEMGGGTILEGVAISTERPARQACVAPQRQTRIKTLDLEGFRLGMTKAEFAQAAPNKVSWNRDFGDAHATTATAPSGQFAGATLSTSVGARFRKGRAVSFFVSQYRED